MIARLSIAVALIGAGAMLLDACVAQPASAPAAPQATGSILASSSPAAGSTVTGPVNELVLRFNPPARLDEVAVSGPQGLMPMMVHAIGEVSDYSLPLPGLGPGAYTVNWRATAHEREYRGSFGFTVK